MFRVHARGEKGHWELIACPLPSTRCCRRCICCCTRRGNANGSDVRSFLWWWARGSERPQQRRVCSVAAWSRTVERLAVGLVVDVLLGANRAQIAEGSVAIAALLFGLAPLPAPAVHRDARQDRSRVHFSRCAKLNLQDFDSHALKQTGEQTKARAAEEARQRGWAMRVYLDTRGVAPGVRGGGAPARRVT